MVKPKITLDIKLNLNMSFWNAVKLRILGIDKQAFVEKLTSRLHLNLELPKMEEKPPKKVMPLKPPEPGSEMPVQRGLGTPSLKVTYERNLLQDINDGIFTTESIVNELAKRDGVREVMMEPYDQLFICVKCNAPKSPTTTVKRPSRIFIIEKQ